jgi:hypothetical protein
MVIGRLWDQIHADMVHESAAFESQNALTSCLFQSILRRKISDCSYLKEYERIM